MKETCAYAASPGQPCSKAGCCATETALPSLITYLSQNLTSAQSPGSSVPVFEVLVAEIQGARYTLARGAGRDARLRQPLLALRCAGSCTHHVADILPAPFTAVPAS